MTATCDICQKQMTRCYLDEHRRRVHAVKAHHLYLARFAGGHPTPWVKIGRSSDVMRRLKDLQNGMPYAFEMLCIWPDCGDLENKVHRALRSHRINGAPSHEWFDCTPEGAIGAIDIILAAEGRTPPPRLPPAA